MAFVDYYEQCEAGLIKRIQTLTDIFANPWQVSSNDAVRSKGGDAFFIVMPGAFPMTEKSYDDQIDWHITSELYIRFAEYEASKSQFKIARAKVIYVVKVDDTLGGALNVMKTAISAPEKPQYYWINKTAAENGANPNFITQVLDVVITQKVMF